ncbi:MAG: tetratricopeptide repeat protein [Desulfobacterium sp.]|nr:tetratricopeptide repeat protein [Desulfobacterium sp.]
MIKFEFTFRAVVRLLPVALFFLSIQGSSVVAATLKGVTLGDKPSSVRIALSDRVPFKVIQVDTREVLIAFKNVDQPDISSRGGKPGHPVENVVIQGLANGVVALVVTGRTPFKGVTSAWEKTGATLVVTLAGKTKSNGSKATLENPPKPLPENPVQNGSQLKPPTDSKRPGSYVEEPPVETVSPSALKPSLEKPGKKVNRPSSVFRGDIGDILTMAARQDCPSRDFAGAVTYLEQHLGKEAENLLVKVIETGDAGCLESAYYLKAYAGFMAADPNNSSQNLTAMAAFQDALVAYPDSQLFPFALAGLGLVHNRLKNPVAAEGFFTIIRDSYREYPGLAQALYLLGMIYSAKGYNDQALALFKEVFEDLPESTSTVDAGIGVGKTLFKRRFYIDSLKILTGLLKSNPDKAYDSEELLLNIGNANLELGRTADARASLLRVLNLFPGLSGRDMIFANIADTYAVDKSYKQAESLYRLVIKTYPRGEGFLNSSMGLALLVEDSDEKKAIYNMVKKDFPDHALAGVAMMRLAEIYQKEGDYTQCIKEIETLLATHSQGMRYEAVKLMEQAYEILFDNNLNKGFYPDILQVFEQKKELFDRMESRRIYLSVGLAYLDARLHEQAFNQLIKAYKLYTLKERPESLLFGLGVAMDETDRKEDALKILEGFVRRFPDNQKAGLASLRMGKILLDKNKFARALESLDKGYGMTRDRIERGNILVLKGEVFKAQKDWPGVSKELVEAVREFALASGDNYDLLVATQIRIGESYLEQKFYVKAAEAFVMASRLTGEKGSRADLGFMLGDAYQKANVLTEARKAFESVIALEDSIWTRLARERLATLDLAQKVNES